MSAYVGRGVPAILQTNPLAMPSQSISAHDPSSEAFDVLWNNATEAPFTGKYVEHHEDGQYICAGCGTALFSSEHKFDSGSGWPSFDTAMNAAVTTREDNAHGMRRTEILCAHCGGHLGHVFPDGPRATTGQRFCVNSAALDFKKPSEDQAS